MVKLRRVSLGCATGNHSYFVDNLLSAGIPSLRASILARFCKFLESVTTSSSMEVRLVERQGEYQEHFFSLDLVFTFLSFVSRLNPRGIVLEKSPLQELEYWARSALRF